MVRMQVQLPEELHERLQALATQKEWSLAETLRRASELLVSLYPQAKRPAQAEWKLPVADVGELLLPESKWAEVLEDDLIERHLR